MDFISKAIGLLLFCFPIVLLHSLESDLSESDIYLDTVKNEAEFELDYYQCKHTTKEIDLECLAIVRAQNDCNKNELAAF